MYKDLTKGKYPFFYIELGLLSCKTNRKTVTCHGSMSRGCVFNYAFNCDALTVLQYFKIYLYSKKHTKVSMDTRRHRCFLPPLAAILKSSAILPTFSNLSENSTPCWTTFNANPSNFDSNPVPNSNSDRGVDRRREKHRTKKDGDRARAWKEYGAGNWKTAETEEENWTPSHVLTISFRFETRCSQWHI